MTTTNRMSRFNRDLLDVIEISGSVDNEYLVANGSIRSKIGGNNPNRSLSSFVTKFSVFSNEKISELYNTEFTEFVEETETEQTNVFDLAQLRFLQNRVNELTEQLDSIDTTQPTEAGSEPQPVATDTVSTPQEITENSSVDVQNAEVIDDLSDVPIVETVPDETIVTENTIILPTPTNGGEQDTDITYDDDNNVITSEGNVTPSDPVVKQDRPIVRPYYYNPYGQYVLGDSNIDPDQYYRDYYLNRNGTNSTNQTSNTSRTGANSTNQTSNTSRTGVISEKKRLIR